MESKENPRKDLKDIAHLWLSGQKHGAQEAPHFNTVATMEMQTPFVFSIADLDIDCQRHHNERVAKSFGLLAQHTLIAEFHPQIISVEDSLREAAFPLITMDGPACFRKLERERNAIWVLTEIPWNRPVLLPFVFSRMDLLVVTLKQDASYTKKAYRQLKSILPFLNGELCFAFSGSEAKESRALKSFWNRLLLRFLALPAHWIEPGETLDRSFLERARDRRMTSSRALGARRLSEHSAFDEDTEACQRPTGGGIEGTHYSESSLNADELRAFFNLACEASA